MLQENRIIYPYLADFEKYVSLKNGTVVYIRPIRDNDLTNLGIFFETLSDESVFYRFGSRRINMPLTHLSHLCQVDHNRDFAFLAVIPGEQETIIGEVRLNRLSDEDIAEISFVIADQWQGKGIGKQLMDFCLAAAKELGLTTVLMEVMRCNIRMMCFGYKYDFQRLPGSKEDDMETLELKIDSEAEFLHPFRLYPETKWHNNQRLHGAYR